MKNGADAVVRPDGGCQPDPKGKEGRGSLGRFRPGEGERPGGGAEPASPADTNHNNTHYGVSQIGWKQATPRHAHGVR